VPAQKTIPPRRISHCSHSPKQVECMPPSPNSTHSHPASTMDDSDVDHSTTHEFLQQAIHSQYSSTPDHQHGPSKRPYSPSLDFAGYTQPPSDNDSDDEAFNQLAQTDPDDVADDAELSASTLRKMLRRMQKLEGAIKKLKQEKQPRGGTTSLDQVHAQTGNHVETSSQQLQQEEQRQQRRQQEEHFASLEMLQAAQMAMPLTVHPDHLSDSQTLASASNYAFDPAHIDPNLLPTSVTDDSNAVASSSKQPPKKKRKRNKGKGGNEAGGGDDRGDADDETGRSSPIPKVRAPKAKKIHTLELNVSCHYDSDGLLCNADGLSVTGISQRAVLRRMYQLLDIRSPKDPVSPSTLISGEEMGQTDLSPPASPSTRPQPVSTHGTERSSFYLSSSRHDVPVRADTTRWQRHGSRHLTGPRSIASSQRFRI
jgi:hypothetical protein